MKASIDKFIVDNYEKMLSIARNKIERFDRSYSPEELVSEAYLYVVNNPPKKEADIPRYMVNFMNIEIVGQNSNTNRALSVNSRENYIERNYCIIKDLEMSDEMDRLREKLSRQNQILYTVYVEKGHTRIREIAAHLDLTMSQAYIARKEFFKEIEKYYESKKRIRASND